MNEKDKEKIYKAARELCIEGVWGWDAEIEDNLDEIVDDVLIPVIEGILKQTENHRKKIDLDRAIEAFRWACPEKSVLKKLDGTKEVYECFSYDCQKRQYRCKGNVCPRLRRFINILKEPEQ